MLFARLKMIPKLKWLPTLLCVAVLCGCDCEDELDLCNAKAQNAYGKCMSNAADVYNDCKRAPWICQEDLDNDTHECADNESVASVQCQEKYSTCVIQPPTQPVPDPGDSPPVA